MSIGGRAKASDTKQKSVTAENRAQTATGTQTTQLMLDQQAISSIIQEVLSGTEGLAGIFQGEQTSGIFNSSVAAQEAGDLVAKIVGEIAQLTGKTVTTSDTESESFAKSRTDSHEWQQEAEVKGKYGF